jgi:hypothetical protein
VIYVTDKRTNQEVASFSTCSTPSCGRDEDLEILTIGGQIAFWIRDEGNEGGASAFLVPDAMLNLLIAWSPPPLPSLPPPPDLGLCPKTPGFWKNHAGVWPVPYLTLGSQTYTQSQLLALLRTPDTGDASVKLAYQLIATKLNIWNGSTPTSVDGTTVDADALLSQHTGYLPYGVPSSLTTGQQMVNDAGVLDVYNNGKLTPKCTKW